MKVNIVIPNCVTTTKDTDGEAGRSGPPPVLKIIRCPAIVLTFVVSIVPVGCLTIASTWDTIGRYIRDIDNLSSLSNGFIWSLPSDTPDINLYPFQSTGVFQCFALSEPQIRGV